MFALYACILHLTSTFALSPSPKASVDLICHTEHPRDCYPHVFQPSTTFQPVHDDQALPAGLHIRMNLDTGKKEAKLNAPIGDEVEYDSGLAVVPQIEDLEPDALIEPPALQMLQDQVTIQSNFGLVNPPSQNIEEGALFISAKDVLTSPTPTDESLLVDTLEALEDLVHDIHWGVELVKDQQLVDWLIGTLEPGTRVPTAAGAAALVVGTAIQNNPVALSWLFDNWKISNSMKIEHILHILAAKHPPQTMKRYVYMVSALCQDREYRWTFFKMDGLNALLKVFDSESAGNDNKDTVRVRISNVLLDHFLQEDEFESLARAFSSAEPGALVHMLRPWCFAFQKTLENWTRQGHENDSSYQTVSEVHGMLMQNLHKVGYSRDIDGSY